MQQRAVDIAHGGHIGIAPFAGKALLRSKVYFPLLDKLVEQTVKSCLACQANTPVTNTMTQLHMSQLPDQVWSNLSADFAGPTPDGSYLLKIEDDFSRFPVVEIINSTSANTVIAAFDRSSRSWGMSKLFVPTMAVRFSQKHGPTMLNTWALNIGVLCLCGPGQMELRSGLYAQ
jgi:hypothetical protein